jgi:hypothetical protein
MFDYILFFVFNRQSPNDTRFCFVVVVVLVCVIDLEPQPFVCQMMLIVALISRILYII